MKKVISHANLLSTFKSQVILNFLVIDRQSPDMSHYSSLPSLFIETKKSIGVLARVELQASVSGCRIHIEVNDKALGRVEPDAPQSGHSKYGRDTTFMIQQIWKYGKQHSTSNI
ncbi:unnamed protein product [Dovyalis caffra]|uniref:Uncharacterized protein n=1 Tax=Dovyalis caffra TaxID=77055 RepID=A0AAV1SSV4_9ROSI|nr:unnamed protein product [Dovyalis caffra]